MEGRRIEGVFLDSQILRSKAQEAYSASRAFELRILSRVPEALLAALTQEGGRFRGTVVEANSRTVRLMLENGFEISAENRLTMPINEGDELTLVLESKNPLILRVERALSSAGALRDVILGGLRVFLSSFKRGYGGEELRVALEDSGIVYEKRIWDFLRGSVDKSVFSSDLKYRVLTDLASKDAGSVLRAIESIEIPDDLRGEVETLKFLLKEGKKLEFFTGLVRLSEKVGDLLRDKNSQLNKMSMSVSKFFQGFTKSLLELLKSSGIKVSTIPSTMKGIESNPKSIDLVVESFKNFRDHRMGEFVEKMRLIGINIEDRDRLMSERERLLPRLAKLVETAVKGLLKDHDVESIKDFTSLYKKIGEDLKQLALVRGALENLPPDIKENMAKLELIGLIQSFTVAHEGKKFLVPFKIEDGEGVVAFSREGMFRIFVKLRYEEGYVGVVITAPRTEEPDYISVIVKTNMDDFKRIFEREKGKLLKEIEDLGLDLRRLEVFEEEEKEFDGAFFEEFAGSSLLNLRV